MPGTANTFSKEERLCGKTGVAGLLREGRWGFCGTVKYCYAERDGADVSRVIIAVPKRFFKRAVKRNLLKRRMREAYRTGKSALGNGRYDILFQYNSQEVADFGVIKKDIDGILKALAK